MQMLAACLWGLGGAAAIEAWTLHERINSVGGFPWTYRGQMKLAPYVVAVAIRLSVGVIVTAASTASNQVAGPVGALAIGIAAPQILQQMFARGPSRADLPSPPRGAEPRSGPGSGPRSGPGSEPRSGPRPGPFRTPIVPRVDGRVNDSVNGRLDGRYGPADGADQRRRRRGR
ncbi:hypothetical protein ACFY2K_36830 [Kitasatospora sp. NPDC001309]|uniref:hypothetical protein n=1 Tax=Kitasatospora sp. NPDC001309 TaxID=3364013 RepID=UPI0036824E4A